MPDRKRAQGFTLVEIAIVLVIIGLLLGGILKGQELIKSARVRNLADQNSAVQAAYYGFIDRYRQVPGDVRPADACRLLGPNLAGCTAAGTPGAATPGGDGNGRVGGATAGGAGGGTTATDLAEAAAVWPHLAAAGFISGGYGGPTVASIADYKRTLPAAAPANAFNGRLVLAQTAAYQQAVGGVPPVRLNLTLGHNIPSSIAKELDTKLDDGAPQTGIIRAAVAPGGGTTGTLGDLVELGPGACTAAVAAGAGGGAGGLDWNIATDESDCNAVILY